MTVHNLLFYAHKTCICYRIKTFILVSSSISGTGADPGFFFGGGAPLRNDVTDGELKKFKSV